MKFQNEDIFKSTKKQGYIKTLYPAMSRCPPLPPPIKALAAWGPWILCPLAENPKINK